MLQRILSTERVLYVATALTTALMLALIPFLGLTPDETRAQFALLAVIVAYTALFVRAQASSRWSLIAPFLILPYVLFITLGFTIMYRTLHIYWIFYFLLPLAAALFFGMRWAYLVGALSVIGFLSVEITEGMLGIQPVPEVLAAGVLLIFTFLFVNLSARARRRAQEGNALATLAAAVSQSLALQDVLETAVEQVMSLLSVDFAAVFTVEGELLMLRAYRGLSPEFVAGIRNLKVGESITGRVAQTGKAEMITARLRSDPRVTREVVHRSDFEAYVGVPIKVRENVVGVLNLGTRQPRVFSADDLAFFSTLADQLATAIQNARLYEESQSRGRRLTLLNEFAALVNRASDLKTLLADAQRLVVELVQLKTAWITLRDNLDEFTLTADHNLPPALAAADKREMRWRPCRCQRMLLAGELTESVNIVECERFERAGVKAHHATVPLKSGDIILGLLNVVTQSGESLASEHLQTLGAMGAQLGVAIERARLHEQVKAQRIEEETALLKLSQALLGETDAQAIMDQAVRMTAEALKVEFAVIALIDTDGQTFSVRAGIGWSPEALQEIQRVPLAANSGFEYTMHVQVPVVVPDCSRETRFEPPPWVVKMGIVAALLVPMLVTGKAIGGLIVNSRAARDWTEDEVRLLSLIANQTAVAYERARLHAHANERLERITALRDIDAAITSQLNLEQTLNVLLEKVAERLRVDAAAVALIESQTRELRYAARRGLDEEFFADGLLKVKEGIAGQVAYSGEPMAIADVRMEPRFVRRAIAERLGIVSYLAVPLRTREGIIGVLELATRQRHTFPPEEVDFFVALAGQAAVAIENARLFEETRRRAEEFTTLYDTARALSAQSDLPALLQIIVERATEMLHAPIGTMSLYDATHDDLEVQTTQNSPLALGTRLALGEGLPGRVAQTRQPLIVNDYHTWEYRTPKVAAIPFASALAVPMLYSGELIGVLVLSDSTENRKFTEADARLLSLFAAQAAAAIRNARLLEEMQHRAEQLALVNHISGVINQPLALSDVLTNTLRELTRVLDVDRAAAATFAESREQLIVIAGYSATEVAPTIGSVIPLRDNPSMDYVLGERRPLAVADAQHDPIMGSVAPVMQSAGVQSILILPLIIQDRIIGTIGLDSVRQPRVFVEEEIALSQTIAHQAAAAIERARLFEEEHDRRKELAALYDLSRDLANASDFDTILDHITRRAVEMVGVTFARIGFIAEGECVVRAAHPTRALDRDLGVGSRYATETLPICERALQQDEPMILRRADPTLTDSERAVLLLDFAQTQCLVPLRVGGRALGLLMLGEVRREEREPFTAEKIRLARSIGDQAASALHRAELFAELERAYLQTVLALANAVDAKDTYTADHAQRLAAMALAVGREMELTSRELEDLRYGAILHDIGKIGVPDAILKKPAKLDAEEWKVMRQHPAIGGQILAPVPRLAGASRIVRHHHERYDGKGYPDGLAGEAIPLGARILTVVDSYSAIVDKRVYKEARTDEEASAELERNAGTQFDPPIVEVFLRLLERGLDIRGGGVEDARSGLSVASEDSEASR